MRFVSAFLFAAVATASANPYFEPNRGQAAIAAPFLARTPAGTVAAGPSAIAFFRRDGSWAALELEGASALARPIPEEPLSGVGHYILKSDPGRWLLDVPRYAAVRYRQIYPNIDLLYRTAHAGVEFDFLLAPHADPSRIRFRIPGNTRIDDSGALVLRNTRLHAPLAWQSVDGKRVPVAVRFLLDRRHRVHLALGAYNRNLPLTIDPAIEFATFLGGSSNDAGVRVLAGADGAIYTAGNTISSDFPASSSPDNLLNHPAILLGQTTYISRLKPDGSAFDWSLFIGGSVSQSVLDLKQDSFGNIYLLGVTASPNFPVTAGAWRTAMDPSMTDLFLVKLDALTGHVKASTFLGVASNSNPGTRMAIDVAGGIYIGGTGSNLGSFTPTPGALKSAMPADGFLLRLNAAMTAAVYATYWDLGRISALDVDAGGGLWIAGNTGTESQSGSPPFAALHPLPGVNQTPQWPDQAYIAHLNPQGSALTSASLFHGDGRDSGIADLKIAADEGVYLAGWTSGTKFPLVNPLSLDTYPSKYEQPQDDSTNYPFLARIAGDGKSIQQSTLFFGSPYSLPAGPISDVNLRLAMQSNGFPCLAGLTMPVDFQTAGGLVGLPAGTSLFSTVGWSLSCEDAAGAKFAFRTALPNTGGSAYTDVAIAPNGDALFTGSASSTFTTTAGVIQPNYGGNSTGRFSEDAFLLRVALNNPAPAIREITPASLILDSSAPDTCSAALAGTGFVYGAEVTVNGQPVTNAFLDSSHTSISFACEILQPGDNHVVMTLPSSGGSSSDRILTGINAPPSVISLSPVTVTQGAGETKLVIRATNLSSSSVLNWNGAPRAASFVRDSSQARTGHFELLLEPSELAQPSTSEVTVTNAGPGGGTSPAVFFVVQPASGPGVPLMSTPLPFVFGGSQPLGPAIPLTGSGFTSTTQAFWDGAAVPVTSVASETISIQPPATDLRRWGVHDVYVANGAYRSAPIRVVIGRSLLAAASAYDQSLNRLYVLVDPSYSGICHMGCDLQILDGASGSTLATVPGIVTGFRAAVLSADGRYLYIAQPVSNALTTILRYNTSTGVVDLKWQVEGIAGQSSSNVNSLASPPDSPETLIVSTAEGQVVIFDRDRPRRFDSIGAGFPATGFSGGFPILFASATRIYGGDAGPASNGFGTCWKWLDYDVFGISTGQASCASPPPDVQHDHGVTYLSDGVRTYAAALPTLLTIPPHNTGYYTRPPNYALDLNQRQAWEWSFSTFNSQLLGYAMDAGQLQVKVQLDYYTYAPTIANLYPTGNGALLAVLPAYTLYIP